MPRRRQSRAWFLVELERLSSGGYRLQAALSKELVERIAHQIDRSTAALSKEGTAADLLLTLFVPDDEVALCPFAAGSSASVEQALGHP
jgi:hypothetical protein